MESFPHLPDPEWEGAGKHWERGTPFHRGCITEKAAGDPNTLGEETVHPAVPWWATWNFTCCTIGNCSFLSPLCRKLPFSPRGQRAGIALLDFSVEDSLGFCEAARARAGRGTEATVGGAASGSQVCVFLLSCRVCLPTSLSREEGVCFLMFWFMQTFCLLPVLL